MNKYTITITRQFGSLGRPIARTMSEILGIDYYDRTIVDAAAKIMNLPVSTVSNVEEAAKRSFFSMQFPLGSGTSEIQDKVFETQKEIISDLAQRESCIIVGRCSDYVLEGMENLLNIYIYAPYKTRLDNCIKTLRMDPEVAQKMITEVDKARDAYHMNYAKYLPSDIAHKDILIDSSILGVEGTAEYLVELVNRKFLL